MESFGFLLEVSESCCDSLLRQQACADQYLLDGAYISACDLLSISLEVRVSTSVITPTQVDPPFMVPEERYPVYCVLVYALIWEAASSLQYINILLKNLSLYIK